MFRVEVGGSPLSGRAPTYGVGEAFFSGRDDRETAIDRRYAYHSIGAVVAGEFDYAARAGRVTAGRGAIIFGSGADDYTVWKYHSRPVHRSVIALDPSLVAEVAADCGLAQSRFPVEVLSSSRAAVALTG